MIKGIHITRYKRGGRNSRWYIYAWRGGPQIAQRDSRSRPKLTTEELRAVIAAREEASSIAIRRKTLGTMLRQYRSMDPNRPSSPEWERLAAGTKKTWGSALDRIEERWGETPLEFWNNPKMKSKVVNWRDSRASTPRGADIGVTALSALLKFGVLRGHIEINVAEGIPKLYRGGTRAEIIWTDDDIERFLAAAKALGRPQIGDGLRLAALTGLRRADLVSLTWASVSEFAVEKLALKRSAGKRRRMLMPKIPALDALLDELRGRPRRPGVETVLTNSFGKPWNADGFGGSFNRVRDDAGIVHVDPETGRKTMKHLHDVRGTFCTRLIVDCELTDSEAAGVMGWAPDKVAEIRRVYVDQRRVVEAIGKRLAGMK